jgi:hypothetical protein
MTATVYGTSQNGCPHDGRMQYAGKGKPSLETMARKGAWPTPQAYDCRGAKTPKAIATHVLAPNKMRLDETKGQALNPAWVESLMGFAPGWTDLGGPLLPGRSSTHGKRRGR